MVSFVSGLTFSFPSGIFSAVPGVVIPSFPVPLAQHRPSWGGFWLLLEVSSEGREGIKVLDGIACSAKLMIPGFLKWGNTKDEGSLVGMIGKALEILDKCHSLGGRGHP